MGEEEWKKWFEQWGDEELENYGWGNKLTIKDMYAAFKSRLASESALVLFPKEPE